MLNATRAKLPFEACRKRRRLSQTRGPDSYPAANSSVVSCEPRGAFKFEFYHGCRAHPASPSAILSATHGGGCGRHDESSAARGGGRRY